VSDQSTEKVFFEIGVGEDPKAISALEKLAKRIEQMQSQMLSGVKQLEQAAKAAEVAVGKVGAAAGAMGGKAGRAPRSAPTTTLPTFGGSNRNTGLPTVPSSLPPDATMPIPSSAPPSSTPSRAPARGRGTSSLPVPYATVPSNGNPGPTVPPAANPFAGLNPSSSKPKSSGRGKSKMPAPFSTLPVPGQSSTPASAPSATIPSAASGSQSSSGVGPDSIERLDKFAKSSEKAFKGVLDLGRGMALLGLVSEENSQKFVQSLVAIEGVVSTIKGGADLAEGLTGLMRGGAGRAAGAAASTAAAGGGGFMSTAVGGVAVGAAGTAAAAAAAIASVTLVAVEIKEIFSGTANQVGSVTDTIATWEVSMVSWLGEMTGWFDLVGNAATKEAEAKSQLLKIEQERIDAIKGAELDAKRSIEFGQAANNEKFSRFSAMAGVGVDTPLQAEAAIYADSVLKFEQSQKRIAEMAAAGAEGTKEYADQIARAEQYSAKIEQSSQTIYQLEKASSKEKIDGAQKSIDLANKELDSRMKMLETLQEQRMTAAERFASLDDFQKGEAVSALRQAQTQGATTLSDEQRSILRSVGGDEATKFAREADVAEARAFGFDTTFGVGFDKQAARLEGEKAKFQAVIQEQNQIIINVEDRTKQVVESIVKEYGKVIQDSNKEIARRSKEELDKVRQMENQKFYDAQRTLKQANK
jgi:hypothetical protein